MMVCTRALITRDKYGEQRFIPWVSHAAATSDYVRQHPTHWTPIPGSDARARSQIRVSPPTTTNRRRARKRTQLGLEPWRLSDPAAGCRHSATPSDIPVRLSASARRAILDDLARWGDAIETGCSLWGRADRALIDALHAVSAGPHARRTPDSFAFDPEHQREVTDGMRVQGHYRVGEAHSHPDGVTTPSPTDLRVFESARRAAGIDAYLGIIATPGDDGWQLHGWVVAGGFARPARLR